MSIVQISKIQLRRGSMDTDRSGLPVLSPGELGYSTDKKRLFVGNIGPFVPTEGPASPSSNAQQNTEIITQNSFSSNLSYSSASGLVDINTVPVNKGGTGQTSYTNGQLLIGNSTGNTLTKTTLTAGSGILITNGAGSITIAATGGGGGGGVTSVSASAPLVSTGGTTPNISLTGAVSTSNGGTGLTSWTAGDIPFFASGTALSKLAIGANGTLLQSNGSAPTWVSASSISFGSAANIGGGAAGSVPYQTAASTTTFLPIGANGTILASTGSVPAWTNASSIAFGSANNIGGGVAGSLPYQTGPSATTFLSIGAANRILTSSGTVPQWSTSLTGLTGVSSSSITNTGLTSGRVVYSGTGGLQTDSVALKFDGTFFTVGGDSLWDSRLTVRPTDVTTVGIGAYSSSATYTGSLIRAQAENTTGTAYKLYEGRGATGTINYWVDGAGQSYFASNVSVGTTLQNSRLTVNANTGTVSAWTSALNTPILHVFGANAENARVAIQSFGAVPTLTLRRANGTASVPTTVQFDDTLGSVISTGYDGTSYSISRSAVIFVAGENWTTTANGVGISLQCTPNGGTATTEVAKLEPNGRFELGRGLISGSAITTTEPARLLIRSGNPYTDNTTAASGTVAHGTFSTFGADGLAASNTGVTYTNASTLYIAGAPSAGTNVTITNPWALFVDAGRSFFRGSTGIGGFSSDTNVRLTVSRNAESTLPSASPFANAPVAHLYGTDGEAARMVIQSFGADPAIAFRRAAGTATTPTTVQQFQSIGSISGTGYNGTAYTIARAGINFAANENWTTTANGSFIQFTVTPNGGTSTTEVAIFDANGRLDVGRGIISGPAITTTDPARLLIRSGNLYTDNTTAASGTVAHGTFSSFGADGLAAANASVTYTNASTLYIAGAPSAGTNVTITNPYSLFINAGRSYLGDRIDSNPANSDSAGFRGVPINSQSANYVLVLADAGRTILHPSTDNNARTFTIPANASVAFPIGTAITFVNRANTVSIVITSDTLVLASSGGTGTRTLAANGIATAIKLTSTEWIISGNGLT